MLQRDKVSKFLRGTNTIPKTVCTLNLCFFIITYSIYFYYNTNMPKPNISFLLQKRRLFAHQAVPVIVFDPIRVPLPAITRPLFLSESAQDFPTFLSLT